MSTRAALALRFQHLAENFYSDLSPLLARICRHVAVTPDLLDLAAQVRPGQSEPMLFTVALHHSVLLDPSHPLAECFSSVTPHPRPPEDAPALLDDFVRSRLGPLSHTLRTRVVQTTEVRRCANLLPGLQLAWEAGGRRPLAMLDLGCGVGLALLFDRFRYEYQGRPPLGPVDSPLVLQSNLLGPAPELPMPTVAWRLGLDQDPPDLEAPEGLSWLLAQIWPNSLFPERAERLRRALELARLHPPPTRRGEMVEELPRLVEEMPEDCTACITHTYSFYELPPEARLRLDRALAEASRTRRLLVVGLEWSLQAGGCLEMADLSGGEEPRARRLAKVQVHGEWARWEDGEFPLSEVWQGQE